MKLNLPPCRTRPLSRAARRRPASGFALLALLALPLGLALLPGFLPAVHAADTDPAPPTNRPAPSDLRSRFRTLPPAEREARLKEWRSRLGPGYTNRAELERRREEWRKLPPAEREARLKELRDRNLSGNSPLFNRLTPAERETKRGELKERVEAQIAELKRREAIAPLSPLEQRRLERFQQMGRRLEQGTALGGGPGPGPRGTNRPPRAAQEGAELPPPRRAQP